MKTIALPSALGLLLALSMYATPAQALLDRTWVASFGNDANSCARLTPCATFQRAHDNTIEGGEINCVDQGHVQLNAVAVTITQDITIDCGGQFGWLRGTSGFSAIVINAPGKSVRLRNLSISSDLGSQGIAFFAGKALYVENCTIYGFQSDFGGGIGIGIGFQPFSGTAQLFVTDSVIENNGIVSLGSGGGIRIRPDGSGSARVVLDRVRVNGNIQGIVADGTNTSGSIVVQVRDSTVSGNAGNGIWVKKAGVVVDRTSALSNAGYGIFSDGAGALVHLGSSTVAGNGGGLVASGGGSLLSYQNNQASGNGFDGAPTGVLTVK